MDFFYDGQIRRYVTQFMRFFVGFKYKAGDGTEQTFPVTYGDMSRQVAAIIRENSENKMISVPKISCYITGLELDNSRISDPTFISKISVRGRRYEDFDDNGDPIYQNVQGGGYTVERLLPTPYKLTMKADIWTSSTDQKLQLLEQILVFFNPSFEIQTTDNYIDWTSLTVINYKNLTFSSRTIPQGTESEIDICSLEFDMPIYISTPAKVKKLGIVKNIITNIFDESGSVLNIDDLLFDRDTGFATSGYELGRMTPFGYRVLLLKDPTGDANAYNLSIVNQHEALHSFGLMTPPVKLGNRVDWAEAIELYGGYTPGLSMIYFTQPNGSEIRGTFVVNPIDPTYIVVSIQDIPSNSIITSTVYPAGRTTIDAIIDPYSFNPIKEFGGINNITPGTRYLMLDDVNTSTNAGDFMKYGQNPFDGSSRDPYDGPDAWKNLNDSDPVIKNNSIIEWTGSLWETVFDPDTAEGVFYFTNLKTGVQYRWENGQWLRSFEGEYAAGYWRFDLDGE